MTVFLSSLSSLFFCSVFQGTSSHSSCTTWQSLQNISTSVRRQTIEWESFLFACRAAGTSEHVHVAGLDHFESSGRISACIVKEHWEALKVSSALATQCETPCATRLSYHGICTILRAIRTIYVIRKGPIRWHIWPTFLLNFFFEIFTEDASLLLLYHDAKKVKNDQNLKS